MKKSGRKASRPFPPGKGRDRRWMEEHVLGDGDLVLYGRLAEDMGDLPPEDIWRELRAPAEAHLAGGEDRVGALHRKVDETLDRLIARDQRFGYPPPFCHKGCSNCCHEVVYCTSEEARHILGHCRERGIPIDRAKLERQLRHVETDAHGDHTGVTTWNDQPEADQACVFLDEADGSCTIWAARPMVCRAHLAEGTDAFCRPRNGRENPEACGINYIEVSYILSSIFTLHRDSIRRTLGRLLLDLEGQSAEEDPAPGPASSPGPFPGAPPSQGG